MKTWNYIATLTAAGLSNGKMVYLRPRLMLTSSALTATPSSSTYPEVQGTDRPSLEHPSEQPAGQIIPHPQSEDPNYSHNHSGTPSSNDGISNSGGCTVGFENSNLMPQIPMGEDDLKLAFLDNRCIHAYKNMCEFNVTEAKCDSAKELLNSVERARFKIIRPTPTIPNTTIPLVTKNIHADGGILTRYASNCSRPITNLLIKLNSKSKNIGT
jgi:hypothetical protein